MPIDFRSALCRWEDELFAKYRDGHRLMTYDEAVRMIDDVFAAYDLPAPRLEIVSGFDDPRIGGFADIKRNKILIEDGFLYQYLILHECAHFLAPHDLYHGADFLEKLQYLYRWYFAIPAVSMVETLLRFKLPIVAPLRTAMAAE